jgi:hypothetical protein
VSALLAIDPGTSESGFVVLEADGTIDGTGVIPNDKMLAFIWTWSQDVAVERFEARGMAIGDESIETIIWTGRFVEAARWWHEIPATLVKRSEVKSHLCGTQKAKDTNIRAALIDIFGPPGTKAAPGGTYGVKSHAWAALGVAATVRGLQPNQNTPALPSGARVEASAVVLRPDLPGRLKNA